MLALRIKKAVRNGGTLVVADPRKIWLTKLAKRHLQLRPGTDVWLLNAMMHTILTEGLQNEEYIRDFTDDFDAVREIVMRYSPEDAEKVTGVPAEDIRATAREYASERHAAVFYTLGITEHACGVDNIWSLSNLVLMTGHLGYESTGLNALRGQNNVQGLNDSGANPKYLPGLPAGRRPRDPAEVLRSAGAPRSPRRPGYRLDQMMSGLHDDRVKALVPHRREPRADRAERPPRRGGSRQARLPDLAGHLPARHDAASTRTSSSPRRASPRRTARSRTPSGGSAACARPLRCPARRRATARSSSSWRRRSARTGPSTRTPNRSGTSSPTSRPNWYGVRYDRLEENGIQWPVPELGHPGTPFLHAPGAGSPARARQVLPGRVPAADRGAGLRVPARPLHRAHALPLQLGDHDDARVGNHGQAGGSVLRDLRRRRRGARARRGRLGAARLAARRARRRRRTISDRVFPGLVWMALHFAEQKVNWLTHDVGDPLIGTPEFKVSAVRVEAAA